MLADLKTSLTAFENLPLSTAEDGYWIQQTYQSMKAQIALLDESADRIELSQRIEERYEELRPKLETMQTEIDAYAAQKAAQEAAARQRAAEEAARRQAEEEAAAAASRAAEEAARAAQESEAQTQPDYSAGPGAFQSGNGPSSDRVTIIPQGPGGAN